MIGIKDMEMPTKCSNCLFNGYYENLGGYICEHLNKITDKDERWEKRLDDCPLTEIVTCKDCDYCRFELVEGIPYYWCDKDDCVTSEDFYCANGERKE